MAAPRIATHPPSSHATSIGVARECGGAGSFVMRRLVVRGRHGGARSNAAPGERVAQQELHLRVHAAQFPLREPLDLRDRESERRHQRVGGLVAEIAAAQAMIDPNPRARTLGIISL